MPRRKLSSKELAFSRWAPIAGMFFGGITLLYFMVLVLLSAFGRPLGDNVRFPMLVVLAIGVSLSAAFLGGQASIKGNLPLPFLNDHPLSVSAGGGVAIFVIVLVLGAWIYPSAPAPSDLEARFNVQLPTGMTLRAGARHLATHDGSGVTFNNCSEAVLSAPIRGGLYSAPSIQALLQRLAGDVADPAVLARFEVKPHEDRGIYEIQCDS